MAVLIRTHKAGIGDHIGSKNGGQPPFHTLSPSARRLTTGDGEIYAAERVLEWRLLAEGVEEVPRTRFLETMIQNSAFHRINITASAPHGNNSCEKSDSSDFFNTLGYEPKFQSALRDGESGSGANDPTLGASSGVANTRSLR